MSDGTQQPLPFLARAARTSPPDTTFPLAAERLLMRHRVESLQRLIEYQGSSPKALRVIITIQEDQIRHLRSYIRALEKAVRRPPEP